VHVAIADEHAERKLANDLVDAFFIGRVGKYSVFLRIITPHFWKTPSCGRVTFVGSRGLHSKFTWSGSVLSTALSLLDAFDNR